MPKISIIVPIYNVEKYLQKCLKSLQSQTLKDTEIILVDDGSTDNSSQIAKDFQALQPDIVSYYRTENKGQSHARNIGLEKATGDYICFVDSDDWIEEDMMQTLMEKCEEYDYDMVCCNTMLDYPNKSVEVRTGIEKDYTSMQLEDKKYILQNIYPIVCSRIYKRKWINTLPKFKEGIWYEDVLFCYEMMPKIQSIGVVEKPFYHYIQRPKSVTYTYNDKLYDLFTVMDTILKYYKEQGIYEQYKDVLEYEYVRYIYATFIRRLAKSKDKTIFKKGVEEALKQVKKHFPEYKNNPYIRKMKPKSLYLRYFNPILANWIYIIDKNKMN